MFGQQFETMGAFVARRNDLPSFADQEAFMRGGRVWTSPARSRPTIEYDGDAVAWFALRTNPRCEDRAQDSLAEKGFSTFAPKGVKEIIHNRTKKRIEREFALLTGYVFVAMPMARSRRHWGLVRECQGVKAPIGVGGEPIELPSQAVDLLRKAEEDGRLRLRSARQMMNHDFVVGERLRITNGPLSGFHGDVIDATSRKAIRLLLMVMGQGVEVEFPVDGGLERA